MYGFCSCYRDPEASWLGIARRWLGWWLCAALDVTVDSAFLVWFLRVMDCVRLVYIHTCLSRMLWRHEIMSAASSIDFSVELPISVC